MGVFDIFKKKGDAAPRQKSDREIARLARLVGDKMSQNYDRQEAIEELSRMANAEGVTVLLKRFDWTLDPSITDQEEKDATARGIVGAGEAALEPLRAYCARAESLTWPLKILQQISSEEDVVDELLGILDQFDTEYVRNPEPKVQLIAILAEYASEDVREAVEPFLQDASEPVRFHAVTTTFAMNNPASVPSLVAALVEEESLRVKNRIAQGFVERKWPVPPELTEACSEALPEDYRLSDAIIRHR
jgi:HEAT repeat protein